MRRIVYAVLVAGLFLLMLSSLVVMPEMPSEQTIVPSPENLHAVFRPLISVVLPEAAAMPANRANTKLLVSVLPVFILCSVPLAFTRDANGRVLTASRYENSVYQLFRPEIAGG